MTIPARLGGLLALTMALLLLTIREAGAWWNFAWVHRIKVTCGGQNPPSSSVTDFPCELILTDATPPPSGQTKVDYTQIQSAGQDLRIIAADDTTSLNFQIEKFKGAATGVCAQNCTTLHAKTNVASSTGTDVYVYFGNGSAGDGQNAPAVWDSSTAAVYLMNESSGAPQDSTSHAHNCTNTGTPTPAAGEVDGAQTYDNAPYSDCGNITTMNGASAFTVTGWANWSALHEFRSIFDKGTNNSTDETALLLGGFGAGSSSGLDEVLRNGTDVQCYTSAINGTGTWHHFAFWFDGSQTGDANRAKIYFDGVSQSLSFTNPVPATLTSNSTQVTIGSLSGSLSGMNPAEATYDYLTFATAARAPEWIKLLYDCGRGACTTSAAQEDVPTPTPTITPTPTNTAAPTFAPTGTPTARPCVGDCNGSGDVTVNELLTMVNIALGNLPVSMCDPGDPNHDGRVTVDEILAAVNAALSGCAK